MQCQGLNPRPVATMVNDPPQMYAIENKKCNLVAVDKFSNSFYWV